jgi:sodium transport system permease protein
LGAGEKERGTLEALLSAPAPRGALVAGKFAATATLAFASTLVAGASQTVVLAVAPAAWFEGAAPPAMAPATAAALAACAAGVAAMSASWLLALSLFARSMREANQYSLPLLVLVMVGGVAAPTLEDTVAAPLLAVVPFVNAVSAMRGALIGRLDPPVLALTLAACGVYALGGVRLAIGLLRRESAILRV